MLDNIQIVQLFMFLKVFPRMPGGCRHQNTSGNQVLDKFYKRYLWNILKTVRFFAKNELFQIIPKSFLNRFNPNLTLIAEGRFYGTFALWLSCFVQPFVFVEWITFQTLLTSTKSHWQAFMPRQALPKKRTKCPTESHPHGSVLTIASLCACENDKIQTPSQPPFTRTPKTQSPSRTYGAGNR